MQRKGHIFRLDSHLTFRERTDMKYNDGHRKGQPVPEHHVTIFRANKAHTRDSIEFVTTTGTVWYLHQVKMTGHSRTNMVYGELFRGREDKVWYRRLYWVEDGQVYVGKFIVPSTGVHVAHCCVKHGCKYGDVRCPVVDGEAKQEHPCEDCDNEALIPDQKIPPHEQDNVLGVLWFLLQEAEGKCDEDPVMKLHVSQTYDLLNRIGYTKMRPRWEEVRA